MKSFSIDQSIKLLSNDFYLQDIQRASCRILISRFHEKEYNLIIPIISDLDISQITYDIEPYCSIGYKFSLYVLDDIHILLEKRFPELKSDYTDLYVYKVFDSRLILPKQNIVNLSKANAQLFVDAFELCYPDWKNNWEFLEWCLDCKYVETLGIIENGKVVSFGSFITKPDNPYALIMNAGTIPTNRRKGFHEYLISARINEILKKKRSACIYANVEKDGDSHEGFQKLGYSEGSLYYVYDLEKLPDFK